MYSSSLVKCLYDRQKGRAILSIYWSEYWKLLSALKEVAVFWRAVFSVFDSEETKMANHTAKLNIKSKARYRKPSKRFTDLPEGENLQLFWQ